MKGGLLLAIRYDSSRFTRDLDFSTTEQYQADMADQLLDEFEKGPDKEGFPGNAPRSLPQPFRGASPQTGQASSR